MTITITASREEIRPIVYGISPYPRYVAIRTLSESMPNLVSRVEDVWRALYTGYDLSYFLDRWLAGFAYRMEIGPGIFLITAALAFGIAVLTVAYRR